MRSPLCVSRGCLLLWRRNQHVGISSRKCIVVCAHRSCLLSLPHHHCIKGIRWKVPISAGVWRVGNGEYWMAGSTGRRACKGRGRRQSKAKSKASHVGSGNKRDPCVLLSYYVYISPKHKAIQESLWHPLCLLLNPLNTPLPSCIWVLCVYSHKPECVFWLLKYYILCSIYKVEKHILLENCFLSLNVNPIHWIASWNEEDVEKYYWLRAHFKDSFTCFY